MIFLTVGTQFPFDRLVRAIDGLAGRDGFCSQIFAQIGNTSYKPTNFRAVSSIEKESFDKYVQDAEAIIGHAGMGTIAMALAHSKPLLVMPRLKKYGEVVHDHQVDIAKEFEKLGHLLVAYNEDQLAQKIQQLKTFSPVPRENQAEVVADRIRQFLNSLSEFREG